MNHEPSALNLKNLSFEYFSMHKTVISQQSTSNAWNKLYYGPIITLYDR
jgi:hypothetical protein